MLAALKQVARVRRARIVVVALGVHRALEVARREKVGACTAAPVADVRRLGVAVVAGLLLRDAHSGDVPTNVRTLARGLDHAGIELRGGRAGRVAHARHLGVDGVRGRGGDCGLHETDENDD